MTLKELRQKRGEIVQKMKDLNDKAGTENRSLTTEEDVSWNAMDTEQEQLRTQIERTEKSDKLSRELALVPDPTAMPSAAAAAGAEGEGRGEVVPYRDGPEYRKIFKTWVQTGQVHNGTEEFRALQADADTEGGYLVPPMQFVRDLIKAVDDQVFLRQLATVIPVTEADSLGAPSLDADPADAEWTAEIATGGEDSTMAFGKRELTPYPLAKRIKVSRKLLRISALPAENIVRDRLGYKQAITQEKAFLTGHGANQPLGVFVASAEGISTGRDVTTGNTTTAIGADGLIEAKYSIKAAYWPTLQWIFHRDAVKGIRKLKDGNGQYLWQPGLQAGQPDSILDSPFNMSEFAPATFTAGLYVGIIGAFSNYWIADSLAMQIQRLDELYAETNQVGFISRSELDGMPVLEEAFARVTLAP